MKRRGFFALFVLALASVTAGTLYSCKDYNEEMYAELKGQIVDSNSSLGEALESQENDLRELNDSLDKVKEDLVKKETELQDRIDEIRDNYVSLDTLEKYVGDLANLKAKLEMVEQNQKDIQDLIGKNNTNTENIQTLLDWMAEMQQMEYVTRDELKDSLGHVRNDFNDSIAAVRQFFGPKIEELYDSIGRVNHKAEANEALLRNHQAILDGLVSSDVKINQRIDSLAQRGLVYEDSIKLAFAEAKKLAHEVDSTSRAYTDSVANTLKQALNDSMAAVNVKLGDMQAAFQAADAALSSRIDALSTEISNLSARVQKNADEIQRVTNRFNNVMESMITGIIAEGTHSPVLGYYREMLTGAKSMVLAAYYGYPLERGSFPKPGTGNYMDSSDPDNYFSDVEAELLDLRSKNQRWNDDYCFVEGEGNAGTVYMTVNPVPKEEALTGKSFRLVNSANQEACATLSTPVKSNKKLTFGYSRAAVRNGFYEAKATIDSAHVQNARLRVDFSEIKDAIKDVLTPDDGVNITGVISTLYKNFQDVADANAIEATWTDSLGEHYVASGYNLAAIAVEPMSFKAFKDLHRDSFWGMDKAYKALDKIVGKMKEISKSVANQFPQFDIEQPHISNITLEDLTPELLGKFVVADSIDTTIVVKYGIPQEEGAYYDEDKGMIVVPADTIEVRKDGVLVGSVIVPAKNYPVNTDHNDNVTITHDPVNKVFIVKTTMTVKHTFTVDMRDEIKELYDKIGEAIGDANEMIDEIKRYFNEDIQSLLDQINGVGAQLEGNLNDQIDQIKGQLAQYIDKIDKKLCKLVNSVHSKLQPVLFVKTNSGFAILSQAKNLPATVGTELVLVPTSYTAELIAPAYKKFVAITDVIKNGQSAKDNYMNASHPSVVELKRANQSNQINGLNVVLPGSEIAVKVTGLQRGCTYEFTYSALDYFGLIVNKKHYVTVQ